MKSQVFGYSSHVVGRVLFVKVPEGSHPHEEISRILAENDIKAAIISGIGGFQRAIIGVFSPADNRYYETEVVPEESKILEVVTLNGNSVRSPEGKYYTHIHVALARRPNEVYAGHLIDAIVKPFLEVSIVELVGDVARIQTLLSHRWRG